MLKLSLQPSWLLAAILAFAHGAACAAVWSIDLPLWCKTLACAVLLVNFVIVAATRALLLTPSAVVALEISSDNVLSLQTHSSAWAEFEVLSSTFVMPWLTILNLRRHGDSAVKRVALLADSLDADDFRKLRVWLRWKENVAAC